MTIITEANYAEEALFRMKSVKPNPDKTIGVTITPESPFWRPWLCYFLGKRMDHRASYMRNRAKAGYMVPCASPADFDPLGIDEARQVYAERARNGEFRPEDTGRTSSEMSAAERQAVLNRLARISPMFRRFATEEERSALSGGEADAAE